MSVPATRNVKKTLRRPHIARKTPGIRNGADLALLTAAVSILVSVCYVLLGYQQWRSFHTPSWDLGIFTQLAKAYAAFQPPIVPIKGDGFNLLGDHFHPLLILLGPLYLLFPSAFTLIAAQSACFGISAGIFTATVYRMAQEHLRLRHNLSLATAFFLGVGFGISWGLQTAAAAQFHEIAFAVPLLTLSLHYFVLKRYTAATIWASPLVFIKEDLGLTLLIYGTVIFWRSRNAGNKAATRKRRTAFQQNLIFREYAGLWLGAWGLFWFVFSSFVILPSLNANSEYAYTKKSGIGELAADPLGTVMEILSNGEKMWTIFLLAAVGAGAPLVSSLGLVMIPTLTWRFLSPEPFYWGQEWHYNAILMPVAVMSLVDLIIRIRGKTSLSQYIRYGLLSLTAFVAVFSFFSFPLKNIIDPEAYHVGDRQSIARAALAVIPPNSRIETDVALMSYLVDDHARQASGASPINTVYWTGNQKNPTPDYVVVDSMFWSKIQVAKPKNVADYAMERHPGTKYRMVFDQGGYQIATRIP